MRRVAWWRFRLWMRSRWLRNTHERLHSALAVVSINGGPDEAYEARMAIGRWYAREQWNAIKQHDPRFVGGR